MKNCSAADQSQPPLTKSRQKGPPTNGRSSGPAILAGRPCALTREPDVHRGLRGADGVNLGTAVRMSPRTGSANPRRVGRATASNLDTQSRSRVRSMSVHAVEFSKTAAPPREVRSLRSAPRSDWPILGQTAEYSARIRSRGLDLLSRTVPAPGGRSAVDQDRTSSGPVRSRAR